MAPGHAHGEDRCSARCCRIPAREHLRRAGIRDRSPEPLVGVFRPAGDHQSRETAQLRVKKVAFLRSWHWSSRQPVGKTMSAFAERGASFMTEERARYYTNPILHQSASARHRHNFLRGTQPRRPLPGRANTIRRLRNPSGGQTTERRDRKRAIPPKRSQQGCVTYGRARLDGTADKAALDLAMRLDFAGAERGGLADLQPDLQPESGRASPLRLNRSTATATISQKRGTAPNRYRSERRPRTGTNFPQTRT